MPPTTHTLIADLYSYQLDFAGLAAGVRTSSSFQIQAQTDFRWTKGLYIADIAGAAQTLTGIVVPLVTVVITDQGSGQVFMNAAVPVPSAFGPGMLPFILPVPRTFKGRSAVTVEVANFSAATTYNLRLTFAGQRLYQWGMGEPATQPPANRA
jgi:hypothetical protein